jgi:hypothetical protein
MVHRFMGGMRKEYAIAARCAIQGIKPIIAAGHLPPRPAEAERGWREAPGEGP